MTASTAGPELVIETDGLTKRYGDVVAVDQLSLRVPKGGVFGFLGPNGSGKTTTMGMLLGLVQSTSGQARIFGDAVGRSDTLRRIGAMVESPTFYPYLSGRANLRYLQGIGRRGVPADIDRLLAVAVFDGTARESVHALKYAGRHAISGLMGRLMASCAAGIQVDVIAPLSLHRKRLRERGYNVISILRLKTMLTYFY